MEAVLKAYPEGSLMEAVSQACPEASLMEAVSLACPDTCLLGDFRAYQTDSVNCQTIGRSLWLLCGEELWGGREGGECQK